MEKLEHKILVCDRQDGIRNAWSFANAIYKSGKNKVPINKQKFIGTVDMAYMSGVNNAIKDVYNYFKANPEEDFDVLLGELQLMVVKTWNNMRENPIGEVTLKPMSLEDVLYERNSEDLMNKDIRISDKF